MAGKKSKRKIPEVVFPELDLTEEIKQAQKEQHLIPGPRFPRSGPCGGCDMRI